MTKSSGYPSTFSVHWKYSFIKCPCACTENSKSFVGPNQTSAHEFREVWWLPRRLSSRPLTSLLFRPSLTFFLFWNIVITCKLREVTSRYSGLQSLSRTPWRGEVVSVDSLYFKTKRMWVKDETKDFSMVPFSRTVSINGDNPPPSRGFSTRTGGHCNGK